MAANGISTELQSALSSYVSMEKTASHASPMPTTLTTTISSAGGAATVTSTFLPSPTASNPALIATTDNNFPSWAIAPLVLGGIVIVCLILFAVYRFRKGYFGFGVQRWRRIRKTQCVQCGRQAKGPCSYCTPIFNPAAEAEAERGFQQPDQTKRGADIALQEFYRSERDRRHQVPIGGYYGRPHRSSRRRDEAPAAMPAEAPQGEAPPSGTNYFKQAMGRMNQPI